MNKVNIAPLLQDKELVLRQPLESDLRDYLSCETIPELTRMYGGDPSNIQPKTRKQAEAWINSVWQSQYKWCMEYDGKCIGDVRLHDLNETDRNARYAIGIFNPEYWNKGIGKRTACLVLGFAFEKLKLHRVDLVVLEYNKRAIASYKKSGFNIEGVLRENALIEGKWENDVVMSILSADFQST